MTICINTNSEYTQTEKRRKRLDFLHKLSKRLIDENQVIAIESLCVKGMIRNSSKTSNSLIELGLVQDAELFTTEI